MQSVNLTQYFLIAMPNMADPHFSKSRRISASTMKKVRSASKTVTVSPSETGHHPAPQIDCLDAGREAQE